MPHNNAKKGCFMATFCQERMRIRVCCLEKQKDQGAPPGDFDLATKIGQG